MPSFLLLPWFPEILSSLLFLYLFIIQMAFELYGMLAGNVSPMTGENVKPAYGGEDEAFLRKVVTPIYEVIARVCYSYILILHSTNHTIDLYGISFNYWGETIC